MTTYRAPSAVRIPQPASSGRANPLDGMNRAQVIGASQRAITSGAGNLRSVTGASFLNVVTLSLTVFSKDFSEQKTLPFLKAQFDNREDSAAVNVATHLSTQYFKTGALPEDFTFVYKLIDAETGIRIGGDYPEFEERPAAVESDLPDFLSAMQVSKKYVAPPGVEAFLRFYVMESGKPVAVGNVDIYKSDAKHVELAKNALAGGLHIQADPCLQTNVQQWAASQAEADEISELFQAVAEA